MRSICFSPPDITEMEIEEVAEALRSGWITTGPRTKQLEEIIARYCGTPRAVCLNSATAALELTLRVLGIGPGDEVITSAYTYTATASVICHVGASPVLIDTAGNSYEMDDEKLAAAITEKTKAMIAVDLGGVICDYDRLYAISERKKSLFRPANALQSAMGRIAILADAAHAFGAQRQGKRCGRHADFTSFSFHAVKNFTTAEGGAVVWRELQGADHDELYRQYMLLSLHGQSKDALAKTRLGAWEYDIVSPAYKCNMTDVMAAIGLAQMRRYEALLRRRREVIGMYDAKFKNENVAILAHCGEEFLSSGHLYMLRFTGKDAAYRNAVIEKMAEAGIATNVHYKPLPMHTAYQNLGFDIKDYPNAYAMYENEITLPLHTKLTDEDVMYVADTLKRLMKE